MISVLGIRTPPGAEPVVEADVAAHLRLDSDDPMVPLYAQAAREYVEGYLSRAMVNTGYRWMLASSPQPGGWPMLGISSALIVLPQWLSPSQIGVRPMTFPREPVVSVDAVSISRWGGSPVALTTDQYGVDNGLAQLNVYGGTPLGADAQLTVDFTAGYGLDGSRVPAMFKAAILLMAAHLYEHRGDETEAIEPPVTVSRLLSLDRLRTFG